MTWGVGLFRVRVIWDFLWSCRGSGLFDISFFLGLGLFRG